MDDDTGASWTGWILLAIVLSVFHLAIVSPLAAVLSIRHPAAAWLFLAFMMPSPMGILVNSFCYGVMTTAGIYFWQRRKPPA